MPGPAPTERKPHPLTGHPLDGEEISIYKDSHKIETGMRARDAQRSLLAGWVGMELVTECFLEEVVVAGF